MRSNYKTSFIAALALLTSGCTQQGPGGFGASGGTPASPVSALSEETLLDYALPVGLGAVVGGVIGNIIGNNIGDGNAKLATALGATVGAGAGAAVGAVLSNRRQAYSTEAELLDSEISEANEAVRVKSAEIEAARRDLAATQTRIRDLEVRRASRANVTQDALALQAELQSKISGYDATIKNYQSSIAYLDELIANPKPTSGEDAASLREKRSSLQTRRDDLDGQFRELNGIRNETAVSLRRVNQLAAS